MVFSKPPTPLTTAHATRLRALVGAAAMAALMTLALPASARSSPITVLVAAPVADAATATMSKVLWSELVAKYVGANVVPTAVALRRSTIA